MRRYQPNPVKIIPPRSRGIPVRNRCIHLAKAVAACFLIGQLPAQTLTPEFAGNWTIAQIVQSVSGGSFTVPVATPDQALFCPVGSDRSITGYPIIRGPTGAISSLGGTPTDLASANASDGESARAITFGPGNVLFFKAGFDSPEIGQIKPGSAGPNKWIRLIDLNASLDGFRRYGGIRFVPPGFPGAGRLKFVGGDFWLDATVEADGGGTYTINPSGTVVAIYPDAGNNLGQFVFVPAGPAVTKPSVLISLNTGATIMGCISMS